MNHIAVIGLGYVGLPLSLQFALSGVRVMGIDTNKTKVESLINGNSYIHHVDSILVAEEMRKGRFNPLTHFEDIANVEAVIICVPTPLTKHRDPDLSHVLGTGRQLARHLRPGQLIILESTTFPGTTEEDLRHVLEAGSNLKAGVDFHLAFSPERVDPGNPISCLRTTPKVIAGLTPICLKLATRLYSTIVDTLVPVSSCRAAEATKLLENIFRSVNIALVNELKVVYEAMGIDIWEVISAAKTKPFGYMPFYPGPGLGGHCIPIDPFYLTWKARQFGEATRFIELAGEINTAMPHRVVRRVIDALNSRAKALNGSKVLILGLAYKANVADERESPTYVLLTKLKQGGADVAYYDPFVPIIPLTREYAQWARIRSIAWNKATIESFDCVLISTAHSGINYSELAQWANLIVDTRNAMRPIATGPNQVWSA